MEITIRNLNIAIIDPYYDVSHRQWSEGWQRHSRHKIDIYHGPARLWKWQMAAGAIDLANRVNNSTTTYDLFVATDMLHVALFKSLLTPDKMNTSIYLYFHENQITYPPSINDTDKAKERDHHYGLMHYTSMLLADRIWFNSNYHKEELLQELPIFMHKFPEGVDQEEIERITRKSAVMPIGLDLPPAQAPNENTPVFLWNHRWEYDKNPDLFFNSLFQLQDQNTDFQVIVTGKKALTSPPIFEKARKQLEGQILHWGYCKTRSDYLQLIQKANILFVSNIQDFFGISVVEGIAAGCYPILPNRLSYPEHIPDAMRNHCFYNTDQEVCTLINQCIKTKSYLDTSVFSDFVQRYNWKNLITSYDNSVLTEGDS